MSDDRPWYREPETFIAISALVVSVSAVVVGLYEASLQRAHDRAEVWPHVEISTFTSPQSVSLSVQNNGIGPAIIHSMTVTIDGKSQHNWPDVLRVLLGKAPRFNTSTVVERAIRAGDRVVVVEVPAAELPPGFWDYIGRVSVRICYASVFGDLWTVADEHLGGQSVWTNVKTCPDQPANTDF